jgi:hypothetical protein
LAPLGAASSETPKAPAAAGAVRKLRRVGDNDTGDLIILFRENANSLVRAVPSSEGKLAISVLRCTRSRVHGGRAWLRSFASRSLSPENAPDPGFCGLYALRPISNRLLVELSRGGDASAEIDELLVENDDVEGPSRVAVIRRTNLPG